MHDMHHARFGQAGESTQLLAREPSRCLSQDTLGMICVASSALTFALVASLTKWADLQAWLVAAALAPITWILSSVLVFAKWSSTVRDVDAPPLFDMFLGKPGTRALLVLRAAANFFFNICFWSALVRMPVGDATALCFALGPSLSGLWAFLLMREPLTIPFYLVAAVNVVGTILVLQPKGIFGGLASDHGAHVDYAIGASMAVASALLSAIVPVLNRLLCECHWTTIQHASEGLGFFVFMPITILAYAASSPSHFEDASDALFCVLRGEVGTCAPSPDDGGARPRPHATIALFGSGVLMTAGLALQTYGYQVVTHTQRANMTTYVEVLLAYLLQHLIFGDPLESLALLGTGLIVLASLANIALAPPVNRDAAANKQQTDAEACHERCNWVRCL